MSNSAKCDCDEADRPEDHLEDVEDGAGCAEIWETLSEQRQND